MQDLFTIQLQERINECSVIAVLVVDEVPRAVPLARALIRGGIRGMELTLRTPAAFEALARIRQEVPEMLAGIGTILTPEQVIDAKNGGATFGVAPGMNGAVVEKAKSVGLPFAPGIATPTDIEHALEKGCRVLKFFPAEPAGGVAYLKSIVAPYSHLKPRFIPLGGIHSENLRSYLELPDVIAVGGSWIAPRDLIKTGNWDAISRNAEACMTIVRQTRGA
jgi:2-dehydro-3-deoxyphosphogluconate aldolase / (4S)-4-hydroxy-2-oxoglutarate aldolase